MRLFDLSRHFRTFPVLILFATATQLVAQRVSVDYDHTASLSQYHTYSINKIQTSDPLNEQRLADALDRDLAAQGLRKADSGGDLAITAIGARKTQAEYTSFYNGIGGGGFGWRRGWGGGGFGETTTTVDQVPIGTLVIDAYDGNSKRLIWRGMAMDTLSNNPEKNTKKLNKAVDKIFAKLPVSTAK